MGWTATYDRAAHMAWLRLDGWDPERLRVEERPWRLIEREAGTDRIVSFEYWKASEKLPTALNALPSPPARELERAS